MNTAAIIHSWRVEPESQPGGQDVGLGGGEGGFKAVARRFHEPENPDGKHDLTNTHHFIRPLKMNAMSDALTAAERSICNAAL